jgi:hypothetical protein
MKREREYLLQILSLFAFKEVYMPRYVYAGPVMEFDICIANRWEACTYAPSKAKARSNLTYQFKKKYNRMPNAKITLPGNILME